MAARIIKDHGIDMLISGEMGPGARTILEAFDIKIHEASVGKKVSEVVDERKKLEL